MSDFETFEVLAIANEDGRDASLALYPLALRKGGRNLKLDGSTWFSLQR